MPELQPQAETESLLKSLMDKVSGGEGESEKASSLPVTLVIIGILVVIVSIIGIKLAFAKRKAAELASKLRKAEEEKAQAVENAKLAENSNARQTSWEEIKALDIEIQELHKQIDARRLAHEETAKELKSITSWDDIKIVDGRRQ